MFNCAMISSKTDFTFHSNCAPRSLQYNDSSTQRSMLHAFASLRRRGADKLPVTFPPVRRRRSKRRSVCRHRRGRRSADKLPVAVPPIRQRRSKRRSVCRHRRGRRGADKLPVTVPPVRRRCSERRSVSRHPRGRRGADKLLVTIPPRFTRPRGNRNQSGNRTCGLTRRASRRQDQGYLAFVFFEGGLAPVDFPQRPAGMALAGFKTDDVFCNPIDENANALGFANNRPHQHQQRVIRFRWFGRRLHRWNERSCDDRGWRRSSRRREQRPLPRDGQ